MEAPRERPIAHNGPMDVLPFAVAQGWACGVNAYLCVALFGVFGRLGLLDAPAGLERTEVIAAAIALFAVDFVADKVPYVDNVWDAVHTVIRPTIAAVVAALWYGDAQTLEQALAISGASLTALASHLIKAALRLGVNTSPEPVSNITLSVTEDVGVAGVVALLIGHPWWAFGLAVVLLVGGLVLVLLIASRVRRGMRRLRARREGRAGPLGGEPS
jgi:hypothetical protein